MNHDHLPYSMFRRRCALEQMARSTLAASNAIAPVAQMLSPQGDEQFEILNDLQQIAKQVLITNDHPLRPIRAMVNDAQSKMGPSSQWAHRLRERCGWQKAVVAHANKNARILWAGMTSDKR